MGGVQCLICPLCQLQVARNERLKTFEVFEVFVESGRYIVGENVGARRLELATVHV